jgi:hypothetical protein
LERRLTSKLERAIIAEARLITKSSDLAKLRADADAGEGALITNRERVVQYEPNLPASGMTMFGENGFLLGREAFKSEDELGKTILHELHRLNTSSLREGAAIGAEAAAAETKSAFDFANRAINVLGE